MALTVIEAVAMSPCTPRLSTSESAAIRHKQDGLPVVIYRDGRAVWVMIVGADHLAACL
jgi:hypothetical protein